MSIFAEQEASLRFGAREPTAIPAKEPTKRQAFVYPVFDRWSAHPGKALTPAKLLAAYRAAEDGWPAEQCEIFEDRIEVDAHARALFEAREEGVGHKDFILQAGGDDSADKKAAALLERALLDVPNLLDTFVHQLRCNRFGYSLSEIWWERRRTDGLAVPVWFDNLGHSRFRFDDHDRPRLIVPTQMEGLELTPGKWWCSTRTGRISAAAGLMRTVCWWSMFKTTAFRDWLIFVNRFGIPYVYGQYGDDVDDDEKEVLKEAVKSIGADGWAILSKEVAISIVEAQAAGSSVGTGVHDRLVQVCNSEISKLVDGATLTTETQGPGSFALGKEHAGRGFDLKLGDARRLAHSFASQVGQCFVRYNNLSARPPRLKFHLVRDESPVSRAKVFDMAVNDLGLDLDVDQVRQELQLKAPTGEALTGTRRGTPADEPGAEPGKDDDE